MDAIASWILGIEKGDFITESLLQRIEGDSFRPMDRDVARENIKLFKEAMDRANAEFFLFFGTLLGAVRERDFISHDYDTDAVIMEKERGRLPDAAGLLMEAGFEFVRCKNHGRFVTFMRKGEYIDVYVAEERHRFPYRLCWNVDGSLVAHGLLKEFTDVEFLGERYRVPRRYDDVLVELYGTDWRIEKRNCSARVPFDPFHPYRSMVLMIRKIVPAKTLKTLKRLLGRA